MYILLFMGLSEFHYQQLRLFRSTGVGPVIFRKLIDRYDSAKAAIDHFDEINKQYKKKLKVVSEKALNAEIDQLTQIGGQFIFQDDPNFPELLTHIHDCPPVLSVIGDPSALAVKQVAIVGNRNASAPSMKFTRKLAADLCNNGYVVTSGLARGIDSAAHLGALDVKGQTVAVLAGGVDHIYPPENKMLYANIVEHGGAIVSEMPLGMAPTQNHFPRRNRIVSGLSLGVVVIEAAKRSGSLITARLAGEQGREVFAMPGSPMDTRSEGPNYLIQNGATMLQNVDDVLNNLPQSFVGNIKPPQTSFDFTAPADCHVEHEVKALAPAVEDDQGEALSPQEAILHLLSSTPIAVDELIRLSNLPERSVMAILSELDLDGLVSRQPLGVVKL